ncbi:MAG TPA: phosphohydrolase [Chloroflexi bacterium]|nr:phosphohydrolase [Chloroflexota bacterium]
MASRLTPRFEDALSFATQLHAQQTRKGNQTPYIAHLLSVAALVLEAGADEDVAIAALLHDAVEDQGGLETLAEIRRRYGERVANIVDSCSDAYTIPKPPWRERKEAYLQHLSEATPAARLVSLADKLHNSRSILRDLYQDGEQVWNKFKGGKQGTLWYYRSLADIFEQRDDGFMVAELRRVVNQIEGFSNQ